MNNFEYELSKILDGNTHFNKLTYVGRTCYGQLSDQIRARMEFVTLGRTDHYEALRVTLLDRDDGKIDTATLRFAELWGAGITHISQNGPYLGVYNGKLEWYGYHPTQKDTEVLCSQLNGYLSMFEPTYGCQEQTRTEPEMEMEMI